jgi:hypothetical protein
MHASRLYYLTRVAAAVAVLLVAGAVQASTIYDLSNSFDATALPPTANPYNVWSCGTFANTSLAAAIPSSFVLDTVAGVGAPLVSWSNSAYPSGAFVIYNTSSSNDVNGNVQYVANEPNFTALYAPAVLRWTAPAAGTIVVNVTFAGANTLSTNYNGSTTRTQSLVWLTSGAVSTLEDSYGGGTAAGTYYAFVSGSSTPPGSTHNYTSGTLTVAAGDTLDLVAQGTVLNATTGEIRLGAAGSIVFTPAPEPSTLVLLAAGLIGLLVYAWRKRR